MSEENNLDVGKMADKLKNDKRLSIGVGGLVALVLGVFLPWYSIEIFGIKSSASPGLGDSTGILLIIAAVVGIGALLNVLNQVPRTMVIVALVASVIAALVVLSNYPDSELGEFVSIGLGYWLSLLGSITAVVATGMLVFSGGKSEPKTPAKPADKSE